MIIPNKFNGFYGGVRRCFGGGGGGGGGDGGGQGGDGGTGDAASATGDGAVGPGASGTGNGTGDGGGAGPGVGGDAGGGPNNVYTPTYTNNANTGTNTNFGNSGTTGIYSGPGVSTPQGMATLSAMKGTPWSQSGSAYNELLNQGFNSNQIRNSASSMYGAPSDANWGAMVQNAGMTSPTGRPMAGSDQFFQPVYNTSYMNYARPTTQFDTSTYGTQPVYSPARAWNDRNSGSAAGGQQVVNNAIGNYFQQNPNSDINSTLAAMRGVGINRTDIQAAGGYNNYGPQMSMPSMQTQAQQPFNPFSNTSGYGGGLPMTAGYGGFGSPMGGLSPFVTNPMYQMQQPYNPFSSQQSRYQPQMQTPFSFQQPSYQPQMQTPFSYQPSYQQQPSYGSYDTYGGNFGGGVNMYTPVTQQPTQPVAPRSSGPSQAIVGRSSQMRGTPNVMRRAEGGIASLMDDVE